MTTPTVYVYEHEDAGGAYLAVYACGDCAAKYLPMHFDLGCPTIADICEFCGTCQAADTPELTGVTYFEVDGDGRTHQVKKD